MVPVVLMVLMGPVVLVVLMVPDTEASFSYIEYTVNILNLYAYLYL